MIVQCEKILTLSETLDQSAVKMQKKVEAAVFVSDDNFSNFVCSTI